MELIKYKIEELKRAEYNPRKELTPEDKEYQKIKKSIEEFGYVEPIIINKDKTIIGGHQRLSVLKDLGYNEVDCIEVELDKTKEKALNIALNKITGEWDYGKLGDLLLELDAENFDLELTGFEDFEIEGIMAPIDFGEEDNEEENPYTTKINIPQYEIKGEEPEISELYDNTKTKELIEEIKNSNVSEEQKDFLIKSAQRHLGFNYSKIAEYYAHQDKEMQELMEKSALVIIDYDDAIKNGYTELKKEIDLLAENEVEEEYDED